MDVRERLPACLCPSSPGSWRTRVPSPSSLTDPQSQPSAGHGGCSGPGRRRPADPLSPCSEPTSRQTCDHACPDTPATALLLSAAVRADRALKPAECFCVKAGSALQYASAYTGTNMRQMISPSRPSFHPCRKVRMCLSGGSPHVNRYLCGVMCNVFV